MEDLEFELFPIIEDDVEVLEIVVFGLPRQIYNRNHYFESMDDLSFFKRFRLTKQSVLAILVQIADQLEYSFINKNNSVSPINQVLIALRFYATANHLLSIADFGGSHVSTACRIVKRVSIAIAGLFPTYIKFPDSDIERKRMQQQFYSIAAFPRILGAIDGTHIRIQSPGGDDAEVFRNRKKYFSINAQIISDANLLIMDLVARWPGSSHDATIFNSSTIRNRFENNEFQNYAILGDSAYNNRNYLFTPLVNARTNAERRYNESHIRTRGIVEKLFGVWKRRFPILAYGSRVKLENTLTIIVATAVLHNIARNMDEDDPPDDENIDYEILNQLILSGQIRDIPPAQDNMLAYDVRRHFITEYFSRL